MTTLKINMTAFEVSNEFTSSYALLYLILPIQEGTYPLTLNSLFFKRILCGRGTGNARGVIILKYGGQGSLPYMGEKWGLHISGHSIDIHQMKE